MEENNKIMEEYRNNYDENDFETKKKYLYQVSAIVRYLDSRIKREIRYRKEEIGRLRDEIDLYWRVTNVVANPCANLGMPKNPNSSNSSSVERIVMDKNYMEDTLKQYKSDKKNISEESTKLDMEDIYTWVFTYVERELPYYPIVFNEVMTVIHSLENADGILLLEDRFVRGIPMKAIIVERREPKSTVYAKMNSAISAIVIPEAQRHRKWIEW